MYPFLSVTLNLLSQENIMVSQWMLSMRKPHLLLVLSSRYLYLIRWKSPNQWVSWCCCCCIVVGVLLQLANNNMKRSCSCVLVEMFENLPSVPSFPLPANSIPEQNSLELLCPLLDCNGSKCMKKFYLCSHSTGTRKIDVSVCYTIPKNVDYLCY